MLGGVGHRQLALLGQLLDGKLAVGDLFEQVQAMGVAKGPRQFGDVLVLLGFHIGH